ncbi:unnamed protein product [Pylaiella littoralis]
MDSQMEIPVGVENINMQQLRLDYGSDNVTKSLKVWNMLIQKICCQPIQQQVLACRTPQQAWRVFLSHDAVKRSDERNQLEEEWTYLKQGDSESVTDYLSRASAIRMKLGSYGDTREDSTMCKHIVRGLDDVRKSADW